MRIDIDTYQEILETLTRNKVRSLLTGFGVFWGVFMLVGLIGGGAGMKEMLSKQFEGFATNAGFVFAQTTTKPYDGFRKGRWWVMDYKDIERLKAQVPELDIVTPNLSRWGCNAVHGDKKFSCNVKGLLPDYANVEQPRLRYGRFLNDMDIAQRRKVCVIGKKVYKTLFPQGGNPCGELVRIDSTYYSVVGVDYNEGNVSINGNADESICVPMSLMQQAYHMGNQVDMICLTGKRGVTMSEVAPRIREVIARAHHVDPTDEKAVTVFNTEILFGMMDSMFRGVNLLIWLVGIGTLLAGAIGVSNIMMVTVKERTTEIGIRRAIGATPRNILSQVISESIFLTAVAGMGGILFAVIILQMLELANTTDGIPSAHFQVGFWTALGAVALLSLLGVLAGLAPASRAMAIKPVDAMREE
ncbi:MAG: ABC transporter permease [Prevotella sp.]|nr:ABC transporter permease [Prevotella sp.]MBQ9533869.1 ABC transporter permease [Prevotella sp.]